MTSPVSILLLDEGHQAFDGLAAAVALFGRRRVELVYLYDRHSVRRVVRETGAGVLVVDIDADADPKSALGEIIGDDVGLRVVVVTDGRRAVLDAALAADALAFVFKERPASELVDELAALAGC